MLQHRQLSEAFTEHPLFENKTWKLSPEAFTLTKHQLKEIEQIGDACSEFAQAIELLYTRSWQGKNILRNLDMKAPWVAEYLDRGKPDYLIEHTRSKLNKGALPKVIRPDLLITEKGFALTEIDCVPGGIGLTAFLNQLYGLDGDEPNIIGLNSMVSAFYESIASISQKENPLMVLIVSDEASTYRPEMDWIAEELRKQGKRVYAIHNSELIPFGEELCTDVDGNPEVIDVIYRFWELFDLDNIPEMKFIFDVWGKGNVLINAPMRHILEEKLNLALFHHPRLHDFWKEALSKKALKTLKKVIPKTWVMDPVDVAPNAYLDGPTIGNRPMWDWHQLKSASQKERNLILKISGFHETSWGARSVLFGSDASKTEWAEGVDEALSISDTNLYILQEYEKPIRLKHPIFSSEDVDDNSTYEMQGRMRLCPYYFIEGNKAILSGILATFCPADKKIIHGMRDAALIPCRVESEE